MPLDPTRNASFFKHLSVGTLAEHLGITVKAIAESTAVCELTVQKHHLAANGYLHAASIIGVADTCAGFACMAHLPQGAKSFTTIELKTNFLGTAKTGATITANAKAVHLGHNTQVWDVTVISSEAADKPIALFRCTQMVLWPKG